MTVPTTLSRRVVTAAGVLAVVTASALAGASPAAAAGRGLAIDYATTGSTTLSNPNSRAVVTFAPTVLKSTVTFLDDGTAAVKAYLPLAPVRTSFKAYGFLPSRGTVVFTQVGPATGSLGRYDSETGFPLNVTARYVVSLRNVVIGGTAVDVGPNCQTLRPLAVAVTAEPGFDLVDGTLNGTYDLSSFGNCGAAQTIINDTVPGRGNQLSLAIHLTQNGAAAARAAAEHGTS